MKELLLRYIKGDVSPDEKEQIIHWLEEDPANMHDYLALRKLYTLMVWLPDEHEGKNQKKFRRFTLKQICIEIAKVAAIILIAVWGTTKYVSSEKVPEQTYAIFAPSGQRVEFYLSDSTKVYLNSGSSLTFSNHYNSKNREVTLNGEGYFDVRRNKEIPFIVKTKRFDVRALGTEFNVIAYDNYAFETALLNGIIEVHSFQNNDRSIRLKPGQTGKWINNQLLLSDIQDYNYFKWKEGLICFENETVGNIFSKLELYYDVKIQTKKESLLNHSYTGKFRVRDGIEHVLKVLQLKHTFTYSKNEETNIVIIE